MALVVERLQRSFGSVPAVRDVGFTVESGTTFGLLGPNGAGKTTTMRMILGILVPDGGSIRWAGVEPSAKTRRRFGYLPEERGLYGAMRVREQIAYFGRLHGMAPAAAGDGARQWIEELGLEELAERPCSELSKGNQQKVQVACAAVHAPELLILDEPFSGLDPQNAAAVYAQLEKLRARGTTLVLSSHQMWQLETLCQSFCIIAAGETRATGTLAELRATWPTRTVTVEPPSDAVRALLLGVPGARELPSLNGELRAEIPASTDLAPLLRELVAVSPVTRFERFEPSLEQIYLRAIGAN